MKTILTLAAFLAFCGFASAADKVDPVGTWKCEYKIGDMKLESTLMVKKDGDKLTATMSWSNQKDAPVKDLKLKDDTLTFSVVRKLMDGEITVDYKLTLDGDKFKGKGSAESGGSKHEFDITGAKEKKKEK